MNLPQSDVLIIEQGSVFLADLNPLFKSKIGKVRPVVVVQSTDLLRAGGTEAVVVPLTSQVKEPDMLRVHIPKRPGLRLEHPSDAIVNQILTLDRSLILKELGMISPVELEKIMDGIKFLLNIS